MGKGIHKQAFFDRGVNSIALKKMLSCKSEDEFSLFFEEMGYKEEMDFTRQFPIGSMYVLDFAFVDLKFNIEIDGKEHKYSKQQEKDNIRDSNLYKNNWVVLRIKNEDLKNKKCFLLHLIKGIIKDRIKEFEAGNLFQDNDNFI